VFTKKIRQYSITLLQVSHFISCQMAAACLEHTKGLVVLSFAPTSKENLTFPFYGLVYQNIWLNLTYSEVQQSTARLTHG